MTSVIGGLDLPEKAEHTRESVARHMNNSLPNVYLHNNL